VDGIVRTFASEVGVDPPIGGATNVQDALAAGGGGGLTVVRHAFDHTQHAALAAGILIATLPDGAIILPTNPSIAILTAFDGSGAPVYCAATTQADAVATNNYLVQGDPTVLDSALPVAPYFNPTNQTSMLRIEGGPGQLWFALTDGAGMDPNSAVGAGELVLAYIA